MHPNFETGTMTRRLSFSGIALALLMVAYVSLVSCNKHVHIIDSEVVAHSHPFQNDSHKHTSAEFSLYQSLSNVETEVVFGAIEFAPNFGKNSEIIPLQVLFCEQFFTRYYSLRAPPALS